MRAILVLLVVVCLLVVTQLGKPTANSNAKTYSDEEKALYIEENILTAKE